MRLNPVVMIRKEGVATGVGAFSVGQGIGETVGVLPGMLVGGAIGAVTGTVHQIQKKAGGDA